MLIPLQPERVTRQADKHRLNVCQVTYSSFISTAHPIVHHYGREHLRVELAHVADGSTVRRKSRTSLLICLSKLLRRFRGRPFISVWDLKAGFPVVHLL